MSNTILENLRSKHEEVEQLEKALAKALTYKENNPKERVTAEIIIKKCIEQIQKRSRELISLYEDKDGLYREEIQVLLGKKHYSESSQSLLNKTSKNSSSFSHHKKEGDYWINFYEKLKEIKMINKRSVTTNELNENLTGDKMFNMLLDECNSKPIFTAEENKGRCIDLHTLYQTYINIKGIYAYNNSKVIDYLTYINSFEKLEKIPLNIKLQKEYKEYLVSLLKYLKEFFSKVQPLIDFNEVQDIIDTKFDSDWEERNIIGWEHVPKEGKTKETESNLFYCGICNKKFAKGTLYEAHLKGKKHLKKAKNDITNDNTNNYEILRELAYYEYQIGKYQDLLLEIVENTKNQIRKKQAMNLDELEADVINEAEIKKIDVDEDDNKKIFNPKNIPIGWDGKPIPYWLYKIHGLGIEYKCEICGGASYWGRRAFEHHFQEWRHTYGMKCLRLPNTLQFKEITTIEDALQLHQKILENEKKNEFRPELEEEFEDDEGNVVNKKMYLDLQKQGVISKQK